MLTYIILIIIAALIFDFLNGFHDAANSIATIVSTRVLTPTQGVIWAAFFNFIAAFLFGTGVAKTIGSGLVDSAIIDISVVFAALVGAIIWNIITWYYGIPSSSSHALVGGVAGAAIAKGGLKVLILKGWVPLLAFIVLSPTIGFFLGAFNMCLVSWMFRGVKRQTADWFFRKMQLVSAAVYSIGHGGNDAQKTMGIIVMLLTAGGYTEWTEGKFAMFGRQHEIALWIILSCHFAIALGTIFGGWRIVKTMGHKITKLQPAGGFCAETAAATTIIGATIGHVPISTTHAITGSILGVGAVRRVSAVRWTVGGEIVTAWILTLPAAAAMSAATYLAISLFK